MRRARLIASVPIVLAALALAACGGGSEQSGYEPRGRPPLDPADWTWSRPTPEMADEAEALVAEEGRSGLESFRCEGARSLDGTGEYTFDCTAFDPEREGRFHVDVLVFGSEAGKPELGPVAEYTCAPVGHPC